MSTRPHTTFLICNYSLLTGVEVFCPKTIDIKQYLSTNNFSVNNKHFVIQFLKIFKIGLLDPDMNKNNFVTNLFRINIFRFSSITRLKQDPIRNVRYFIFFILDDIPHVSLEQFNILLS